MGSLRVILLNASKQHLTEMMLASDLQMLGLPYHYQSSICRPYSDHKIELQEVLASQILLVLPLCVLNSSYLMILVLIGIFML